MMKKIKNRVKEFIKRNFGGKKVRVFMKQIYEEKDKVYINCRIFTSKFIEEWELYYDKEKNEIKRR